MNYFYNQKLIELLKLITAFYILTFENNFKLPRNLQLEIESSGGKIIGNCP